jgi:hypothetical protein
VSKNWQIYYNAVFGAIGGLLGWFVIGQLDTGSWRSITLAYIVAGAGIGFFIGAAAGAVEGIIIKQSVSRAILGAAMGGLAGLASGVVGLFIGQQAFLLIQGGLLGRAIGWTFLGLFLGLGEGIVSRKVKQTSYGAIGGTIAGFLGGLIYESMTQLFLEQSNQAQIVVGGLGLIIIGASLGGLVPLSVDVIARVAANRGMVRVLNGRRAGLELSVVDVITLGSYDGCDLYLPGDSQIEKKHAKIGKGASGFSVLNIGATPLLVNDQPVYSQQSQLLSPGSQIRLGQTIVLFE